MSIKDLRRVRRQGKIAVSKEVQQFFDDIESDIRELNEFLRHFDDQSEEGFLAWLRWENS